ncbi:MAG: hypothetical protein HY902_20300 [Deltaproteobacteria bacterium]|nr:hypothetical protein [Deltaproteobacteria bacterium]
MQFRRFPATWRYLAVVYLAVSLALTLAACSDGAVPVSAVDGGSGDALVQDSVLADSSKGDAPGKPGQAKDIVALDGSAFPDLPPNTPPTANWLSPAEAAILAANLPSPCTIEVADGQTAAAQLGAVLAISDPPPQPAVVTQVSGNVVTLRLPGLAPGPHTLTLTVTDGMGGKVVLERHVTAQNPPGAPQVAIEPPVPYRGQDLLAKVATPLQPGEQHQFAWYRNALKVKGLTESLVPGALLHAGESWRVEVVVVDGPWQSPIGSAEVLVANSAPSAVGLALSPTAPTLASTVQCQMVAPATDADGDALTYSYAWTLNGVPLADAPTLEWLALAVAGPDGLTAAFPVKIGDVLGCSATATDGVAISEPASATATLVQADLCTTSLNPCSAVAECIPTDTLAVQCACKPGYVGDGAQCFDVDECALGGADCDANASCSNAQGSYTCQCLWGYSGNGKQCADLDECADGSAFCDLAADCSNTAGSYACACQPGYQGNGLICTDIDECSAPTSLCDPIATCVNLPGAYQCNCPEGFVLVGQDCVQP